MKNNRIKLWFRCCLLAAAALALQSCSTTYSGESIEGWVVDAGSGKPLGGVVVVSVWEVSEGNVAGTNDGGHIQIQETVTDARGRYFLPAWGPLPLPKKKNGWWVDQYIAAEEPGIIYFKADYGFDARSNDVSVERVPGAVRRSKWNGKTIQLKALAGRDERVKALQQADSYLYFAFRLDDEACPWKRIPRMLTAVIEATEDFQKRNRPESVTEFSMMIDRESPPGNRNCGSMQDFLKEYSK